MVAKVISGKNIRGVLNYNENKVAEGVACCIAASRFGSPPEHLTFSDKLNRFRKVLQLNSKVKTNAIHISLNFDVTEKLSNGKLDEIAAVYMTKIGFGEQPYLVYRHMDASHPHVHIVTINIKSNGQRIDIHNIGRTLSEDARKEIEVQFELVRAEGRRRSHELANTGTIPKLVYGKSETKRSISNVVRMVTQSYKFTSLPELNAVLQQFNVVADRGAEGTLMHRKNGLQYCLIDTKGKKIGVPIKASSIYGKPTLKYLEKQFDVNDALRKPFRNNLKSVVDYTLSRASTKEIFVTWLAQRGVRAVFRENDQGRVYGLTFIDERTKAVFKGSDLGKPYSAQSVLDRLIENQKSGIVNTKGNPDSGGELDLGVDRLVSDLLVARQLDFQSSGTWSPKRKKKKKKKGRSL